MTSNALTLLKLSGICCLLALAAPFALSIDQNSVEARSSAGAQSSAAARAATPLAGPSAPLAFPGAEGFGAATAGGRGGKILKVTTLADKGPGSLRWALEEIEGPRIVVFATAGVFELEDEIAIGGQVTVAGQTAPWPGITVRGARLQVAGDDVIIRGMRLRPGRGPGQDLKARDAISVGARDRTVRRVIIDSNSLTWGPDENAATWFSVSDVTFSRNIIAEALFNQETGQVSLGMLIGDGSERVTVVRNLMAHSTHRNPAIKSSRSVEVINNLIYNYGHNGMEVYADGPEPTTVHAIGNVFAAGPDTVLRSPIRIKSQAEGRWYYLHDNMGPLGQGGTATPIPMSASEGLAALASEPVFEPSGVKVMPADVVRLRVLAEAGARVPMLEGTDLRIITSVIDGTGQIVDHPPASDGPDVLTAEDQSRADTDGDGIPDSYEAVVGGDPAIFDAHDDGNGDGYANIESYINGLIDGFQAGPTPCRKAKAPKTAEAAPDRPVKIEAETLVLKAGFEIDSNPHACGKQLIRSGGPDDARAELVFSGEAGSYDVAVTYFDENDGVSVLGLEQNGRLLDLWSWNDDRGSAVADPNTRTQRTLRCLSVQAGDRFALFGVSHDKEPLRIDMVEFTPRQDCR